MMPIIETIDPVELAAYADDQLDVARRIAVERWLSQNPDAAAQVMADLRLRDELRLVHVETALPASAATEALALRLGGRLQRDMFFRRVRPLLAASLLMSAGWLAHAQLGNVGALASSEVPEYVTAAVEAHYITELRAQMHSQPPATEFDSDELLARTDIRLPSLPAGWTITDVQVYPSEYGPSVEIAVNAANLGAMSIFAARPGQSLTSVPVTQRVDDTVTAYWQYGEVAYALVGSADPGEVSRAATTLFETLQ
jgi:anti-sigma factor RsiW